MADLGDIRKSAERAQVIVVTKCKPDLSQEEKMAIIKELRPKNAQKVYFTTIEYGNPYHLFSKEETQLTADKDVLLITGIANPRPLKELLTTVVHSYEMLRYPDHHIFDSDDLTEIIKQFEKIQAANKLMLTTEKDGVRMQKFENGLADYPIYVIPVKHRFLFDEQENFNQQVIEFIRSYKK